MSFGAGARPSSNTQRIYQAPGYEARALDEIESRSMLAMGLTNRIFSASRRLWKLPLDDLGVD